MVSLTKIREYWTSFGQMALHTILPYRCAATGQVVSAAGALSAQAWKDIDFITSPLCHICGAPFDFAVEDGSVCDECQDNKPCYARARSAVVYNDAAKPILLGFKHADKLHAVKTFTPWLLRAGADVIDGADIIIPVPLHYWRMVGRRYNQALLIARDLSKSIDVPVLCDGLRRTRYTRSQGHLSPQARLDNIAGAFRMPRKAVDKIQGKTVLLIDDVYTTGATANECSKIILENGAKAVHILTVAKALK